MWDNGTAANYRCSGAYDLRIIDSAPTVSSSHQYFNGLYKLKITQKFFPIIIICFF